MSSARKNQAPKTPGFRSSGLGERSHNAVIQKKKASKANKDWIKMLPPTK